VPLTPAIGGGGTKRGWDPSISLSVWFPILSRSPDGGMCASPFHTHSIGGGRIGCAGVQNPDAINGGVISLRRTMPCFEQHRRLGNFSQMVSTVNIGTAGEHEKYTHVF